MYRSKYKLIILTYAHIEYYFRFLQGKNSNSNNENYKTSISMSLAKSNGQCKNFWLWLQLSEQSRLVS